MCGGSAYFCRRRSASKKRNATGERVMHLKLCEWNELTFKPLSHTENVLTICA